MSLADHLRACDGCGKKIVLPYHRDDAIAEGRKEAKEGRIPAVSFHDLVDGVLLDPYVLYHGRVEAEKVLVCPGKGLNGASVTCLTAAYRKASRCMTCGKATHRWPFPCEQCAEDAAEGMSLRAAAKERGDVQLTLVGGRIENLYSRFEEKNFENVLEELFTSFGVRFGDHGVSASVVLTGGENMYGDVRGVKAFLNRAQRDAVAEMMRWLNVQVARACKDNFARGADILNGIITGALTVDAMNEKVASQIASFQKDEEKVEDRAAKRKK